MSCGTRGIFFCCYAALATLLFSCAVQRQSRHLVLLAVLAPLLTHVLLRYSHHGVVMHYNATPLTPFAAHRFVRRRTYRCFDAVVGGSVPPDGRIFYRDDFDVALLLATLILLHYFLCGSRSTLLIHEEPELSGADGPVSIWSCKL